MSDGLAVLLLVIVTALAFDFTNGFHDTANAMAASIATGALGPRTAVTLSALLNLAGAFLSVAVAATVAKGIVDLHATGGQELLVIVFAGLAGGIVWNLVTWLLGLPSSSSHALIGGLVGATIAALGTGGVEWHAVVERIVLPSALAPFIACLTAACGTRLVTRACTGIPDQRRRAGLRWGQICASGLISLAHGTNDAQKTMGVVFLALVAYGSATPDSPIPVWVKLACALSLALGTYVGGWRVIRTLGKGLVDITRTQGMSADFASASIILTSSHLGLPLSTTQVATGSIVGSGLGARAGGRAAVRWRVVGRMVTAWVLTLPAAALTGAGCWWTAHSIGGSAGVGTVFAVMLAVAGGMWLLSRRTRIDSTNVNAQWDTHADSARTGLAAPSPRLQSPTVVSQPVEQIRERSGVDAAS